jgi:hypothetical protein
VSSTEKRALLRHFLAALAYRTQKALRGAPERFCDFRAGPSVQTPHELIWHMTDVLGFARALFTGEDWRPDRLEPFAPKPAWRPDEPPPAPGRPVT